MTDIASRTVGAIAIARSTFDIPFAEKRASAAFSVIAQQARLRLITHRDLVVDDETLAAALTPLREADLDAIVIVQASFADSTLAMAIAQASSARLVLWAMPEERTGGRLRSNSFCGINLAAYALRRAGRDYRFVLGDPSSSAITADLTAALGPDTTDRAEAASTESPPAEPASLTFEAVALQTARNISHRLSHATVGLIGERPPGFEPCDYDGDRLGDITGVRVDPIGLPTLFETASGVDAAATTDLRLEVSERLSGVDDLDLEAVDQSLRLHQGMQELAAGRGWSGFATRCWPECFTEFGAAACSAMSLSNSSGVPGCCEADVYGAVTSLILQWATNSPAFVADLVDLDFEDNTGVLWHCGLAPLEMAGSHPDPRATIHSNRAKPLLNEFALRPGRVTLARLSQSRNEQRLVIGGGNILDRPMAFGGTSGVIRFDRSASDVFQTVMSEGLEHHYGVAYGDVRTGLAALAHQLEIATVELT